MSSIAAASSSLCMVALGSPKSTTGHSAIRNRPSDVPPWVESFGSIPVSSRMARATMSYIGPGGVRNASTDIFASTVAPGASLATVWRSI